MDSREKLFQTPGERKVKTLAEVAEARSWFCSWPLASTFWFCTTKYGSTTSPFLLVASNLLPQLVASTQPFYATPATTESLRRLLASLRGSKMRAETDRQSIFGWPISQKKTYHIMGYVLSCQLKMNKLQHNMCRWSSTACSAEIL